MYAYQFVGFMRTYVGGIGGGFRIGTKGGVRKQIERSKRHESGRSEGSAVRQP